MKSSLTHKLIQSANFTNKIVKNTYFKKMNRMSLRNVCYVILVNLLCYAQAINCKGCVPLDVYTFDKIISKFKASVVKFDVAYPYGAKHDEFAKVAEAAYSNPDLLIGEVGVKDYGEKENTDLAERYNINKEDFPVVMVFTSGKNEPPYTFKDPDFTADNIKKFVRSKSGVHIGLPGCLEEFDKLATTFASSEDLDARKGILHEAEQLLDTVGGKLDRKTAETYIKTMQKVLEKGDSFIVTETKRVQNLAKGNIKKEKRDEMQHRLNILQSFQHDEL